MIILEVERGIGLRQFSIADAPYIFELIDGNREHLSQYGDDTAGKYPNVESVIRSIRNPVNTNRLRFGIWYFGNLTGSVNLTVDVDKNHARLGYYLGAQFQGKGLIAKSAKRLVLYALNVKNVKLVDAEVHEDNARSIRVLERLLFIKSGTFVKPKTEGNFLLYVRAKKR